MDCDYPQHSVSKQKQRDISQVHASDPLKRRLLSQSEEGRQPYPVMASTPDKAIDDWESAAADLHCDIVLFDLPGTAGTVGVLSTLVHMDYLFVPMKADRMVLESTLNFATTINDRLVKTGVSSIRELYLFWNMVDRRERNRLFEIYDRGINQLGLSCLHTAIPVRSNFNKEVAGTDAVYRSTLFAVEPAFAKECGLEALMTEICNILNIGDDDGR